MSIGRSCIRLLFILALSSATAAVSGRLSLIDGVLAQPPSDEEKKKKEREKQRPPEQRPPGQPAPQKGPPPGAPRASPTTPPPPSPKPPLQTAPKVAPPPVEKRVTPSERQAPAPKLQGQPQIQGQPPVERKMPPQFQGQPAPDKKAPGVAKPGDPRPEWKKDDLKRGPGDRRPREQAAPPPPQPVTPQAVTPPQGKPQAVTPPSGPTGPAFKAPAGPAVGMPGPKRLEDVRKERRERVEEGGRRRVIEEPGNRMIVKEGDRAIIRHDEAERFSRRPGARAERRSDGSVETFYVRPDGVRIVTVVDANGRLIRRYRRDRDGRERNIIDNRRFRRNLAVGVGIGVVGGIIALNLPPPRITIPRERYIVEYEHASDDDLYEALEAPPIERLDRAYSLDEIRDNYELRARVRRIDLDTINFDFGSWEVAPDQYYKLERIARAILRLLERNPEAVVMVEGHTDAVGPNDENLSLSDRRASKVAEILTDQYDVPPENLVTQGYGEEHLKVETQGPERLNRRVTILNITELMAER